MLFLSVVVAVVVALLMQDSTATGGGTIVGPLSTTATILIGLGATLATGLVRGIAGKADAALGTADKKITKVIGPALPLVAVGFAALLPMISNAIGLSEVPNADTFLNAPASAVVGIVLREAWSHIFGKRK
jgi:hypothetical protein